MGPRLGRRGRSFYYYSDSDRTTLGFNGAAPRKTRKGADRGRRLRTRLRFNGAAPRKTRKGRPCSQPRGPAFRLQWGRASEDAEGRPGVEAPRCLPPRFNGAAPRKTRKAVLMSRPPTSPVQASMGPRLGRRGRRGVTKGRTSWPLRFNGAAPRKTRKVSPSQPRCATGLAARFSSGGAGEGCWTCSDGCIVPCKCLAVKRFERRRGWGDHWTARSYTTTTLAWGW